MEIPALTQAKVMVRSPVVGLQSLETHPHLMRRRLAMVARGLCDVVPNCPIPIFMANWAKKAMMFFKEHDCRTLYCVLRYPWADITQNRQHQYDSTIQKRTDQGTETCKTVCSAQTRSLHASEALERASLVQREVPQVVSGVLEDDEEVPDHVGWTSRKEL